MSKGLLRRVFSSGLGRRATAAGVAVAVVSGVGAAMVAPAQALEMPNAFSCAWNSTAGAGDYFWFKIRTDVTGQSVLSPACWVNSGIVYNINQKNVWGIHSGNNAGIVDYQNPDSHLYQFGKWHDDLNYYGTVWMLDIF